MKNDNVIPLEKPVENEDLLTAMLRQGAKGYCQINFPGLGISLQSSS
jgi:hypothetical protein